MSGRRGEAERKVEKGMGSEGRVQRRSLHGQMTILARARLPTRLARRSPATPEARSRGNPAACRPSEADLVAPGSCFMDKKGTKDNSADPPAVPSAAMSAS